MRVAFLINDLSGGGAEKALGLLSGFLADHGATCRVFTLQSGPAAYSLHPHVHRQVLRSHPLARGVGKLLSIPIAALELHHVFKTWAPDVSVSFLPRANLAHVMTKYLGSGPSMAITEQISSWHNYRSGSLTDRTMRILIRTLYPHADRVFPAAEGLKQQLVAFGVSQERMVTIPNPISLPGILEQCQETRPQQLKPDKANIISVGRLVPQKDHASLFQAFALLRRSLNARLVIFGQGPLRADLQQQAERLGIADDVHFVGWQGNPFVWMASSDLFVLSSRYEGFGNVLVEAMACGLPVVSTDCPSGPSEVLLNGKAGRLVPVGDPKVMATTMLRILGNERLRSSLAKASRRRAMDFDITVVGPKYLTEIQSLASNTTWQLHPKPQSPTNSIK